MKAKTVQSSERKETGGETSNPSDVDEAMCGSHPRNQDGAKRIRGNDAFANETHSRTTNGEKKGNTNNVMQKDHADGEEAQQVTEKKGICVPDATHDDGTHQ